MMTALYVSHFDTNDIFDRANRLILGQTGALGLFVAETETPSLGPALRALAALTVPVFGGVFPGLIHDGIVSRNGALLVFLRGAGTPVMVGGLEREESDWLRFDGSAGGILADCATALILVDGRAPRIARFLEDLYRTTGRRLCYLGGGAGSQAEADLPCVFVGEQVRARSAVVVPLPSRWNLGVRHGWHVLHEPLLASRTRGNVIEELNWLPAFDVYREALRKDAGVALEADNFASVCQAYPFGLYRKDTETVVREALRVAEDGALVCVADVPQNATLSILCSNTESMVAAARSAAAESTATAFRSRDGTPAVPFVLDCVSRESYLGADFEQELSAISEEAAAAGARHLPVGLLTLGEIASDRTGALEYYNKTIVVGSCHD